MVNCWASALGDCGKDQSREHYLSASIIGSDDVVISGLPFLNGEQRRIPGKRLVAKMLCKRHNEILSPLDAAAGHFFQVLSAFKIRGIMRARGAKKLGGIDVYEIDGAQVERWMLKTVINLMFERELNSGEKWVPPELWVRCVFGKTTFPDRCGLYILEGEALWAVTEHSSIGIRLMTRSSDDEFVIGGQFQMAELQFALAMEPLHARHQRLYRVRVLKDKPSLDLLQIANFIWTNLSSG